MELKELKFLIRQIVREEIINLVKEKNLNLTTPEPLVINKSYEKSGIILNKNSEMLHNPFDSNFEDYYSSKNRNDPEIKRLTSNLEENKHALETGAYEDTEIEEEYFEKDENNEPTQKIIETNLESKISNNFETDCSEVDTSQKKAKELFDL
jgi:hypothetical protein